MKQLINILFGLSLLSMSGQDLFEKQDSIIIKTMSQQWELNSVDKRGTFKLNSYKPFYIHPVRWSSDMNKQPQSEGVDNQVEEPVDLDATEVKFQLSFKTKVVQSFLFGKGDVWAGYTQVAHWQLYNKSLSRPFRELNYEPEVIATYPLNFSFLGFKARMVSFGFNHQSNGRADPISRSWNRLMFQLAIERDNLQIYLKPWFRLPDTDDDNPDIVEYIGRGEATVIYKLGKHSLYAIGTNNLSSKNNRGSIQLNYLYPIKSNLRAHLQLFSGFGETLIDYNHNQTTASIGLSFVDW